MTADVWELEGPHAPYHVGDLAWMRFQHRGREDEWRVRLWQDEGRDVAWAWLRVPDGDLFSCIRPDARAALLPEVVDWAESGAHEARISVELESTDVV
ncbi:MAG TPA: hypothetical protein VFB35_05140, partial [Gaiellaceae bacterium]|nr:hypothetical protein [Gaiellaceae bacterium]